MVLPVMLFVPGANGAPNSRVGCGRAARISFCFANAAFTPPASFSSVPSPPMCMK